MSLDWMTMRQLASLADPVGVLSIYVTLDLPERAEASRKPAWELRIRHQLGQLRDRLRRDGPREHWKAFAHRLDELRLPLERLLDPAAPGQGRALFAGVADGRVHTVELQVPLVDRVVMEPRAYLRPLVAAWSSAGPAGAVSVSATELRVVDLRFGRAEVVDTIRYEGTGEQRALKGPAAGNPALSQHGAPQHDLFERREEDRLLRFLRTAGPRLAQHVTHREWGDLALTGEATLVQAVREGLPPALPAEVVTLDHPVSSLPRPRLAATVTPALEQARQRRHRALAERARGNALSANAGACGLGETLGALQQGRVAHLLLDADRQWAGSRTPDGFLVPGGELPPGVAAADLCPEPHLGERMLELAFRDGARVTMLDPDAVAPLADGAGAILRW
ncbi:MAG: hypothetical protein GEV12_16795 [Micromonosporaceae bacterium]|nr:hypothetical protein [Micromonosporaceae bacterium]